MISVVVYGKSVVKGKVLMKVMVKFVKGSSMVKIKLMIVSKFIVKLMVKKMMKKLFFN